MEAQPQAWAWPDFDEPELVARMALDEDEFRSLWIEFAAQMPIREYTTEAFELGTSYPWPRPDGSFILSEGVGELLADLEPEVQKVLLRQFTGSGSGRTPMLAIGSNASPEGLWRKFSHFENPADRTLLAVSGRLHDFDVGPAAELALYGAMPATIFPSPGTRVNTWAVWLTDTQLTQLAWAEIPYWIGRLDSRFEAEGSVASIGFDGFESSLVFVNRFGAFAPEGHPYALDAIPALERTAPALGQVDLLQILARTVYGPDLSPEALVRAAFESPAETGKEVAEAMRSNSMPFESDRWTPLPGV